MRFTEQAIRAMGFTEPIAKSSVTACFMSVTVYDIRGVNLPDALADARKSQVEGVNYRVALSKSVNAACQRLVGDDFTDEEDEWRRQVRAGGPFALIAVGPTDFIDCDSGWMQRLPNGSIHTHDCFPTVGETLKSLELRALPPIVTSLTIALSETDRPVLLRKLSRESVGRTPGGTTVVDSRLEMHAEMFVSRSVTQNRVVDMLDACVDSAPKLHRRAAYYFSLGLAETDKLKKFLYFFLSIEVSTHAVFKRYTKPDPLRGRVLRSGTDELRQSTAKLIARDIAAWRNLSDRFVWCATVAWPTLTEDDIETFKELKGARDAIAHGESSEPPAGFARKAELLAHGILSSGGLAAPGRNH